MKLVILHEIFLSYRNEGSSLLVEIQAQKPWAKKLKVVEQCKKEYHVLCQKEQSAIVRQHNAKNDSNFSDDQVSSAALFPC